MSRTEPTGPAGDPRAAARSTFVRGATGDPGARIERASADASARSYWRARSSRGTAIVMDAPPGSGDLAAWLDIDARLRGAGLNAPEVLAAEPAQGFLLLSDFGTDAYLSRLDDASADQLYGDALAALRVLQTRVDSMGLPVFDAAFVRRELELMPTWFLARHLGVALSSAERDVLAATFDALARNVLEQPRVFMHRDFHSRNLMYVPGHNPGIIDFQDAVLGPVTYDLASLLRDCYIAWDAARVEAWSQRYRMELATAWPPVAGIDPVRWRRWFDLTGLQRHVKVLGIFCRLWYRDGKRGYLMDLPRVWRYVHDVAAGYPELAAFLALLERHGHGRDLTVAAA